MDERHLIYRIIEYGMEKQFFSYKDLKSDLKLSQEEDGYVNNKMVHWMGEANPNHLLSIVAIKHIVNEKGNVTTVHDYENSTLALLSNAVFQYNDYIEIIEARKSAQEAKKLSWYAIWISIGLGAVQIIIGYLQLR